MILVPPKLGMHRSGAREGIVSERKRGIVKGGICFSKWEILNLLLCYEEKNIFKKEETGHTGKKK